MTLVSRYWRPRSLDEALLLERRPHSVFIAGGTRLHEIGSDSQAVEVIDLQDVVRSSIKLRPAGVVNIGAGTTLQQIADDDRLPDGLRQAARRERPSALRTWSTLGAFVAHPPVDSELAAILIACDADVETVTGELRTKRPFHSLWERTPIASNEIITEVQLETAGRLAQARTARTPADRPIVAAAARAVEGRVCVVLMGVARHPVVGADRVQLIDELDGLGPVAIEDFRGSSEYRQAIARILADRVITEATT